MKHRFFSFFLFMSIVSIHLSAQQELQKVLPLSPNAASIAKYGEIPVGYFTGVPNISIPIYSIKSKNLTLPLSLNYHAGGNKVEDIASSVGLGWSISNIPSISRRVNGIPDESSGGFFSTYYGETVKSISDRLSFGSTESSSYRAAIYEGQTDTEADIFSFNLEGKSGKFFWDQQTNRFLVTPWSNIKIEFVSGLFKIIDENGSIYWFTVIENSTAAGVAGLPTSTTWWISKIYDPNKTDSLLFNYSYDIQIVNTLNSRYKLVWGSDCDAPQSVSTLSNTGAYSISRIDFNNGYAQFNKEVTIRQDLNGGYALKNIEIYNTNSKLIKKYDFSYVYRGSGQIENKRLLLDNIDETTVGTSEHHKHTFIYESQIDAPSRLSPAQDYWGFYNGVTANTDLIPTANITLLSGPVIIPGADRIVHPEYTQFSILNRIYYPTGGYSDFQYENNTAYKKGLSPKYKNNGAVLQADELDPPSNNYSATFEVNNPPDYVLNGGLGGANANIQVGGMACIGCSLLTLRGLDNTNNNINTTISYNFSYHLPNGNYEMTANFGSQPPDDFKNYYYTIHWKTIDSSSGLNDYVGGLRVKAIKSDDGSGNRIIRSYQYTNGIESDTSSGDIFSTPYFTRYQDHTCMDYSSDGSFAERYSYKIMANPNITQVTHSGCFIGYNTVYEKVDSLGVLGFNEYKFTNRRDIVSENSPFPPPITMETLRGQPLEQNVFRKSGSYYIPVRKIYFEYKDLFLDHLPSFNLKTRLSRDPVYNTGGTMATAPVFDVISYDLVPSWSAISKKTERNYDAIDTTKYAETVTQFDYNNLHLQVAQINEFLSNHKSRKTKLYYPGDADPDNGSNVLGIPQMWDASNQNYQHIVNPVIKTKIYVENTLARQESNTYSYDATNKLILKTRLEVLPVGIQTGKVGYSFSYDKDAQLQNVIQDNDIPKSIIWGYSNYYPIANVNNATPNNIYHTSFEDAEGNSVTDDSKTGRKSRTNGYSKALAGLTNGDFILSYWQKYPNEWILNSSSVTVSSGSFTINLTGQVDEVRFYPKGSQMTTYTYDPLIGKTSECDANNRITYYEYDSFGRLKNIRDQDRNIVKRFDYGYAH